MYLGLPRSGVVIASALFKWRWGLSGPLPNFVCNAKAKGFEAEGSVRIVFIDRYFTRLTRTAGTKICMRW